MEYYPKEPKPQRRDMEYYPQIHESKMKLVMSGDEDAGQMRMLFALNQTRPNGVAVGSIPADVHRHMCSETGFNHSFVAADGTLVSARSGCHDDNSRLRPLQYPGTHVLVVCFSVMQPSSFANVREKWLPELWYFAPGIPIILVGTDLDLRVNPYPNPNPIDRLDEIKLKEMQRSNEVPITFEQGTAMAAECGLAAYRECSWRTQEGLKDVFDTAVMAGLHADRKCDTPKRQCTVM